MQRSTKTVTSGASGAASSVFFFGFCEKSRPAARTRACVYSVCKSPPTITNGNGSLFLHLSCSGGARWALKTGLSHSSFSFLLPPSRICIFMGSSNGATHGQRGRARRERERRRLGFLGIKRGFLRVFGPFLRIEYPGSSSS